MFSNFLSPRASLFFLTFDSCIVAACIPVVVSMFYCFFKNLWFFVPVLFCLFVSYMFLFVGVYFIVDVFITIKKLMKRG